MSDSFGPFLDDVQLTAVPPKISWVNGATWSLLEGPWSDRLFGTNSINAGTTSAGYSVDLAGSESAGFYLAYLSPGEYGLKFGGTLDYEMELPDYERKFDIVLTSGSTEVDRKQIVVSIGDVSTFATIDSVQALPNGNRRVSYTFNANQLIDSPFQSSDSKFEIRVQKKISSSPDVWQDSGALITTTATTYDIGPYASGDYRVDVTGIWTKAGENGNDVSTSFWNDFTVAPLPVAPIANDFSKPHNYAVCAGYGAAIDIPLAGLISDADTALWALTVSKQSVVIVSSTLNIPNPPAPGVSIIPIMQGSGPFMRVDPDNSVQAATYNITYRVTDPQGLWDEGVITVTITNSIDAPTATITTPGGDALYLVDAATPTKDVDIQWDGNATVETFDWEMYIFEANGDTVVNSADWKLLNSGNVLKTVKNIDMPTGDLLDANGDGVMADVFGLGMYLFRVKSKNCIAEESAWDDVVFIVASTSFSSLGNSEDQCMVCSKLPAEQPAPDIQANSGDGTLAAGVPGPKTGDALAPFADVQSTSSTNPHPVAYTQLTIPKGISTTIELWGTPGASLLNPPHTIVTIPASQPAVPATSPQVSPFVPVQWVVAPAASSGVTSNGVNAKFTLAIPGLAGTLARTISATSDQPRQATVPYLDQANSAFGRRMGVAGMQSLYLPSGGKPMLVRGNGTFVEFSGSAGNYTSPNGSFLKFSSAGTGWNVKTETGDQYAFDSTGKLNSDHIKGVRPL